MSKVDTILKAVKNKAIPYTYKVGEKGSKSLPVDIKLSIDADFKKSITKWVSIGAAGIGFGIAAGIVISKLKR